MSANTHHSSIHLRDLYLAAYLRSKGHPLLDTKLDNQRKVLFIFKENTELTLDLRGYYDGTALISPTSFIEAFKSLRSLAYSLTDNRR